MFNGSEKSAVLFEFLKVGVTLLVIMLLFRLKIGLLELIYVLFIALSFFIFSCLFLSIGTKF